MIVRKYGSLASYRRYGNLVVVYGQFLDEFKFQFIFGNFTELELNCNDKWDTKWIKLIRTTCAARLETLYLYDIKIPTYDLIYSLRKANLYNLRTIILEGDYDSRRLRRIRLPRLEKIILNGTTLKPMSDH